MEVHYKDAIGKRNQWMVGQCGVIVDCTYRDFDGSFSVIQYARKRKNSCINNKKVGINIS